MKSLASKFFDRLQGIKYNPDIPSEILYMPQMDIKFFVTERVNKFGYYDTDRYGNIKRNLCNVGCEGYLHFDDHTYIWIHYHAAYEYSNLGTVIITEQTKDSADNVRSFFPGNLLNSYLIDCKIPLELKVLVYGDAKKTKQYVHTKQK